MYINYFQTYLGQERKIEQLPFLKEDEELLQLFQDDGFDNYLQFEENIIKATEKLLGNFINKIGDVYKAIDCVLFVSDNNCMSSCQFNEYNPFISFRNNLYRTLASYGINTSFPYIVGGAGCANITQATQLASGLMEQGIYKNILVLLVDKFEDDAKRLMPLVRTGRFAAGSIGSDIGAALILSKEPLSSTCLKIKKQLNTVHLPMIKSYYQMIEQGSQASYMLETVKGLVRFRLELQQILGKPVKEFEKVYTGNYMREYFKIYAQQFFLKPDQIDMTTKSAIGHAQSLDALVSIFSQKKNIEDALIFLIGPCMWSAVKFSFVCDNISLSFEEDQDEALFINKLHQ